MPQKALTAPAFVNHNSYTLYMQYLFLKYYPAPYTHAKRIQKLRVYIDRRWRPAAGHEVLLWIALAGKVLWRHERGSFQHFVYDDRNADEHNSRFPRSTDNSFQSEDR